MRLLLNLKKQNFFFLLFYVSLSQNWPTYTAFGFFLVAGSLKKLKRGCCFYNDYKFISENGGESFKLAICDGCTVRFDMGADMLIYATVKKLPTQMELMARINNNFSF